MRRNTVGQSPYRGSGRRGGGQFKRNVQGNFSNHPPRTGGLGPPFRGKGRSRGRGGPKRVLLHGPPSCSHTEPYAADAVETEEEAKLSDDNPEEMLQGAVPNKTSASTQGSAALSGQPTRVAWCELCRVDCTSLEILEQHKNGKRHRKNLQRFEKLKSAPKTATEIQGEREPVSDSSHEVDLKLENVLPGEENKEAHIENFLDQAVSDENKVEMEQLNDQAKEHEAHTKEQSNMRTKRPWMNRFDNQRHGMKRKMRGGRGGKRLRTFGTTRWPVEPLKSKVVIPLICDLCNVKCDTQEVFDHHLSGKKHISKLKRYEGHQAMYGPMGLQALYPPNPIAQTLFLPQGPQATYGPPGSYPPPRASVPPRALHIALSSPDTGSEFQQYIDSQMPDAICEFVCKNALPGSLQQRALVEPGDTKDAS